MDTAFSKVVTDLTGKDHIMIEGRIIEIVGNAKEVNPVVDAIVRGLRSATHTLTGVAQAGALVGGFAALNSTDNV